MKFKIFAVILSVVLLLSVAIVYFVYNQLYVQYEYDRVEKAPNESYGIEHLFLNSKITVKNNVLVAKQGKNTMIVLELKENNKTGLNDYTYTYTKNGIKLVYQNRIIIYLKKV